MLHQRLCVKTGELAGTSKGNYIGRVSLVSTHDEIKPPIGSLLPASIGRRVLFEAFESRTQAVLVLMRKWYPFGENGYVDLHCDQETSYSGPLVKYNFKLIPTSSVINR